MVRGDGFLGHVLIDGVEGQPSRQDLRQQRPSHRGIDHAGVRAQLPLGVAYVLGQAHLDLGLQIDVAALVGAMHLGHVAERHALALGAHALAGHVIEPEHDVLRGHDDRVAVGRRENVVGRHHQGACFELRFDRQRHVHGHLVAVEVGVECRANQRMELDGLALDQHRLECLDAETMQGRGTIQQHRMFADHLFQDVPNFRSLALHQPLRGLDGGRFAAQLRASRR